MRSIHLLEVIFKIAERCNINCTYCYYFNMGENTAMSRPSTVNASTVQIVAKAIAQGCVELKIPAVRLHFHGGEPLLIRHEMFEEMCETLYRHIEPVAELSLTIQTNAMLLNERWIESLNKFRVSIGVSIDGDQQAHDRYRVDKKGRSTFQLTEQHLRWMLDASQKGGCSEPSTISVIDTANDYREIYAYLRSLGVYRMGFLLPDRNVDDAAELDGTELEEFGESLYQLFEAWFREDNTQIRIRHIDDMLENFQSVIAHRSKGNREGYPAESDTMLPQRSQVVIIRSDGTIAVNDSFIPALSWYALTPVFSLNDRSLKDFLQLPEVMQIPEMENDLPEGCHQCKWKYICKGGDLENRYSKENGFNNPSVYCSAYKYYYEKVCRLLIENGFPNENIPVSEEVVLQA